MRINRFTFKYTLSAGFLALALFLFSCRKKDPKPEEEPQTFPKQEMLVNLADQVILPAYRGFDAALDSLRNMSASFTQSPDAGKLNVLRNKFNEAYLAYQAISLFGFGPGEDQAIRSNFNVFPLDTNQVKANIQAGTYNLGAAANVAAKGFPAIDYLLFRGADNDIVAAFADAKRGQYLSDVLSDLSQRSKATLNGWNSYRNTFVNSLGTDISSSIGFLVNQLNFELDNLKNLKLGIPLGLKSDGQILPGHAEALYSGRSQPYALATLQSIESVYLGRDKNGNNGKGFDDYLDHLGATRAGSSLNAAIIAQFGAARAKLNEMNGAVSDLVSQNPGAVQAAYNELVKLLVLLKTDMPSSLGVVITYQDGDGD